MIILDYWAKPIPIRDFDWCATFDGYEPGDPIGYGATREEAILDLMSELEFRNEKDGTAATGSSGDH